MPLLDVQNLKTYFHTRAGTTRAVDDISFSLEKGEIVGVVGESGSGKSVTCHSILGLLPQPPARVEGGSVTFDGDELIGLDPLLLRAVRGRRISMIFQDPMSCLNPYLRILDQVAEPILVHEDVSREEAESRALEMLKKVGIRDAEKRANSFPHEFSGGMRQRAMIAMALVTKPDVLFADEPTTALDVTVQARILQILRDLRDELGVAVLFITHDLGVVAEVADRVVVMYRGKVVEQGTVRELFKNPSHPYVKGLLACRPSFETKYRILPTVEDFLETKTAPDGSVTLRERPDAAQRLEKLESDGDLEGASDSPALLLEVKDLKVIFAQEGDFGQTSRSRKGGRWRKPEYSQGALSVLSANLVVARLPLVVPSYSSFVPRLVMSLMVAFPFRPCCRGNPPVSQANANHLSRPVRFAQSSHDHRAGSFGAYELPQHWFRS